MSKAIGLRKTIGLELFRILENDKVKKHELRTLFWECTLRCNLNCLHCGSDCKKESRVKDMPFAHFLRVIDNITPHVNPHKVFVIFTGGECLLRDDLANCGASLYEKGFPWGIVTNGMLLTEKRLNTLLESGIHAITVSLDGFEKEHNNLRGNRFSFQKASEAIKNVAAENDLVSDVVTCVNPDNLVYLDEFSDYLTSLGVKKWRLFTIFPTGRATSDNGLQLNNKQFVELMEFIKRKRKDGGIIPSYGCEGFLGKYETEVRDNFYNCSAGINIASVLADGTIAACPSIRNKFAQGSIYNDLFIDVWNTKFVPHRDRSWAKKGECSNCEMFKYCKGNGMHLRDDEGNLTVCHFKKITG